MPVLENVRDSGRTAEVILQNVNLAVAMANEVSSSDVAPNTPRWFQALTFLAIPFRRSNDMRGNDAVFEDFGSVIEVVDEKVQRENALFKAALDAIPFGGGHDAWHQVEGERLLDPGTLAIDVESNSHLDESAVGGLLTVAQLALGKGLDVARKMSSGGARFAI